MLIVDNALKFNEGDSDVYDKAQKLKGFIQKEMESVLEVAQRWSQGCSIGQNKVMGLWGYEVVPDAGWHRVGMLQ